MDKIGMQTKEHSYKSLLWTPWKKIKKEQAKLIYHSLENQVSLLMKHNEIILGGDFNAKLETVSKEGTKNRVGTVDYSYKRWRTQGYRKSQQTLTQECGPEQTGKMPTKSQ